MEPYIGEIKVFAFGNIPRNWVPCAGQLMSIAQNQALFALLGTTYGGNGVTTFALPNLCGRGMVHFGSASYGGSYYQGQASGSENVTLLTTQLPQHNHAFNTANDLGSQVLNLGDDHLAQMGVFTGNQQSTLYAVNGYTSQPNSIIPLNPNSISNNGGNQPHNNAMPYLTMSVCIAINGIWPSRD